MFENMQLFKVFEVRQECRMQPCLFKLVMRSPLRCIAEIPISAFCHKTFLWTPLFARLVTKANLERTVPALKELLISSEEGVARVRGAVGDTKGEVCYLLQNFFMLLCHNFLLFC